MARSLNAGVFGIIGLAIWELVGRLQLIAQGALPAPSAIVVRFLSDIGDYPGHIGATALAACLGFLIGNAVAISAGMIFSLFPRLEQVSRGFNIAIFALPPIAIVPILILLLDGLAPRILLAALGCYFTTMTATMLGLRLADPRSLDLVRAYGGNAWQRMRLVQFRQALPAILAGLQIAAPNAVLGSILAEFGGGGRFGLGVYLIGSLGRADPARLWGIGLAATALAGIAYGIVAILARYLAGASRSLSLAPALAQQPAGAGGTERWLMSIAAILLPFLLWWLVVLASGAPSIIAKTPLDIGRALLQESVRAEIVAALAQTLPFCLIGMLAGLGFAFGLALISQILPAMTRLMLPVALVSQSMPLVALTPLLVLIFGRGWSVTAAITISVTFFPAYVTLVEGLRATPRSATDLVTAYGGSMWQQLRLVKLPSSIPYLFAAARLALPRALLGVMIAEWLATGKGLGGLLNQARGSLNYTMIWSVALVSVLVAIVLYQGVCALERRLARRF